jgi:hypothetical protein
LRARGDNSFGQLGIGATGVSGTPVTVKLAAGLTAIAIGAGPNANFHQTLNWHTSVEGLAPLLLVTSG